MYRASWKVLFVSFLGAVAGSTGCTNATTKPSGSLEIVVSAAHVRSVGVTPSDSSPAPPGVDHVTVTVTGDDIPTPIQETLSYADGRYGGTFEGIPISTNVVLQGAAYDASGNLTYAGSVSGISITGASPPALVALVLQDQTPPSPFVGGPPVIDAIVASTTTPDPNAPVALSVVAHDAYADIVTYEWSTTGGSFDNPSSRTPIWTAPAVGEVVTLRVSVCDALGGTATTTFPVQVTSTGTAELSATFNSWPAVSAMFAYPSRIVAHASTTLAVTAADPDGDSLFYAWITDCQGSFDDATLPRPTFTLTALPDSTRCVFNVTVSDTQGGATFGQYAVPAASDPPVRVPSTA